MSQITNNIFGYNPKFSPTGYNTYVNNYNALYNIANPTNGLIMANNSNINSIQTNIANNIESNIVIFDNLLTTNAYDNVMNIINSDSNLAVYKAQIINAIHNAKLNNLTNELNGLNAMVNDNPQPTQTGPFFSLKSQSTSEMLNIEPIPTQFDTWGNPIFDSDPQNSLYMLYGNRGCLAVTSNTVTGSNGYDYNFATCNANPSAGQQFTLTQINNANDYNNNISSTSGLNQLNTDNIMPFGFYIVSPSSNNNIINSNCLSLGDNGLTVQPCDMSTGQKFNAYYSRVL